MIGINYNFLIKSKYHDHSSPGMVQMEGIYIQGGHILTKNEIPCFPC